jgi:dienelactone hydrolase
MINRRIMTNLVLLLLCTAQPESAQVSGPFSYESNAPLDVREAAVETLPEATVHDVSYASPKGGRVPAYLVVPKGNGPFAAIEFVHWGQGNRSEFLSEALFYARAGVVSLMIDAPYRRPEWESGPSFIDNPQKDYLLYTQLVIDARRGLDLLLSRRDVDPKRVAYVGHSLGATWGGALAGVDKRVRAVVLIGGLPSISDFSGDASFSKEIRQQYKPEQIEKYTQLIKPLDPENFVSHAAPTHLFFQFARWDRYISMAAAKRYETVASEPKRTRLYNTSHEFNDLQSWCDRVQWIASELQLLKLVFPSSCSGNNKP